MWVVYWNPRDYPGRYVVRRQWVSRGDVYKEDYPKIVTKFLSEARDVIPDGLVNIGRMPEDDDVILEVWL
jgi:hypothetical protein